MMGPFIKIMNQKWEQIRECPWDKKRSFDNWEVFSKQLDYESEALKRDKDKS